MKYTIIEDCSPYFIRFKCEGIDEVIKKSLKYLEGFPKVNFLTLKNGFTNHRYTLEQSVDILKSVPMFKELTLNPKRVSMFITPPGCYYRAHKDGLDHRYSLNYTVKILDSECETCWYADEDLKNYPIDNFSTKSSRECVDFDKTKHTPLKKMIAMQEECILFNTEIFHDFDNSNSKNERMVLTFRNINPGMVYFEDVRQKLFGI